MNGILLAMLLAAAGAGQAAPQAGATPALFEIGREDRGTAELALGPDGYGRFEHDGLFVVGLSDARADWPYVQPGPADAWAGSREHSFAILFELEEAPGAEDGLLVLDLADTHYARPPRLRIALNGETLATLETLAGASDASLEGAPQQGIPRRIAVPVPGALLRRGENDLCIASVEGSWFLYDAVSLHAPPCARLATPKSRTVVLEACAPPMLVARDGALWRPLRIQVRHFGAPLDATLRVGAEDVASARIEPGVRTLEALIPEREDAETLALSLDTTQSGPLASATVTIRPVRRWIIYLLHHTHLDIGYTHTQEEVEALQLSHLDTALELIRATDDFPEEARFRWLPEGLFAVESFLAQADAERREAFLAAVRAGRIGLDALYGNALTALYSDEELFALLDYAVRLRQEHGIAIDSAMISDVPGLSWGLVPVLAQCGVRYLSLGPNLSHRRGWISVWDDRPFYWVSPCGRHKVLFWQAGGDGYATFHRWRHPDNEREDKLGERRVLELLDRLGEQGYPYDLVQLRCNIDGDNGPPDPHLADSVRRWNEQHAFPRIVLATTSRMFHDFEERYGDRLPARRGDLTPYWEDGAASTAADTAQNRGAAETLLTAQALFALLAPASFPAERFAAAWRDAVLYDEHTWGAWNSISEPDSAFARDQAARKSRFAWDAERAASELLDAALASRRAESRDVQALEVFNVASWPRTDLVLVPADWELCGDVVVTEDGVAVPSQRLRSGELAFIARDVPPFGSARFFVARGFARPAGRAAAAGNELRNGLLEARVDAESGAIVALRAAGIDAELAAPPGLNEYVYVAGRDPAERQGAGPVRVTVQDPGPLVATLRVESSAPGARALRRDLRLIDGIDRLDVTNVLDKLPVRDKEGVHFGFAFAVPDCEVRVDTPWAVVRPEADQLPGACRNYFTAQRWVDASNAGYGVTLATVDAPLVQVGDIHTDVAEAHSNPEVWLKHIEPSPRLFSYVMNNYWETNYKADQEGETVFRYSIRPHAGLLDQAEAARFGVERCRPLVVTPARPDGPPALPALFTLDSAGVLVTALRPSQDGAAWIIRLFAAADRPESVRLRFAPGTAGDLFESGPDESRGRPVTGAIDLPAGGIATLRAERG
ncbi:MAG: hypothetical protein HY812_09505 [Planctomycetes bacterium]|nr:hypothetical protein [Planctomycetota bacterium]